MVLFPFIVVSLISSNVESQAACSGNGGISPAVASFVKPPYLGSVWFTGRGYWIHVNGSVSGFQPRTQHGVHVHQYGGLGNNCNDAGPHWNLYNSYNEM
uniref:Superoxide dismutase copper/zinc binding domain-containing protein n=1 Tax=Trichobilharzia regenti TaxID=157069 RepID=A0AA85KJI0_TRIRE|nr:unnamed protein product [Trichobilharzia regenti]